MYTTGIYALYWETTGLVYIGQSIKIELRYIQHLDSLSKGTHYNYKVQKEYNAHGTPTLVILETCDVITLDSAEISWISEFNATKEGLNILIGGTGTGSGLNHSNSRYSKILVLRVFSMLYSSVSTYSEISRKTKIPVSSIHGISSGKTHIWLRVSYPDKYALMLLNKDIRSNREYTSYITASKYPKLIDSDGNIHTIDNILHFCKSIPLLSSSLDTSRSHIGRVLRGKSKQYKGFKVYQQ